MPSITITPVTALWALWGILFLFFIGASAVLTYHLVSYSGNDRHIKIALWTYYIGAVTLLVASASFIAAL